MQGPRFLGDDRQGVANQARPNDQGAVSFIPVPGLVLNEIKRHEGNGGDEVALPH